MLSMSQFSKLKYYDLTLEASKGRITPLIGRVEEVERITRVLQRRLHSNCLVVGPSGSGKTSLVQGWAAASSVIMKRPIVQIDAASFHTLGSSNAPVAKFQEAFDALPQCVLIIDDWGSLVYNQPTILNYFLQLLPPLMASGRVRLILVMETKEYKWFEAEQPNMVTWFETVTLKAQPVAEQTVIVDQTVRRLRDTDLALPPKVVAVAVQLGDRFASLGPMPGAAVRLLDESLALAERRNTVVTEDDVYQVMSAKTGVPLQRLQADDKETLKHLEGDLNTRIIGQAPALKQLSAAITRAKLGLKNPNKPLGSFLLLGPSGVGKTETAKFVAEKIFGTKNSFVRIDMSEFGEAHTVARLIGAPAGYVGFDAGGGLTNAVKQEPYSLVLLDEIEKAHPKIFDVFLQVLDDGRATSGQGETVDFTHTIIMATSNLAVPEIIAAHQSGEDIHSEEFYRTKLMPALARAFRLEFINRFDAVLVYKPLDPPDLLQIAQLTIKKVEARAAEHNIKFKIDPNILVQKIQTLADPRFGARPVVRFVESVCEDLISRKLLS